MIESVLQVLQIIGMLTIVFGLVALIVGAIYRYLFLSDLRYDLNALKERLSCMEGRLNLIESHILRKK